MMAFMQLPEAEVQAFRLKYFTILKQFNDKNMASFGIDSTCNLSTTSIAEIDNDLDDVASL